MKARKIGLIGLGDDGMLYTPNGHAILRIPKWIGRRLQGIWNWMASH